MARSLTKKDKDGKPYTRGPEVEAAIDAALQQDITTLQRRASCSKRTSPDFMPLECLVHVIREAWRQRDEATMNVLLPPLLGRCEAILKRRIPNTWQNAADIREEILSEFSVMFAEDGTGESPDALDFYECRFMMAFRSLRIGILRQRKQDAEEQEISSFENEAADSSADEERLSQVPDPLRTPAAQVPRTLLVELIDSLPRDERDAVVLCHIYGYKQESDDPTERTAASICGVSGRTIRNRLGRAMERLSKLNEEAGT